MLVLALECIKESVRFFCDISRSVVFRLLNQFCSKFSDFYFLGCTLQQQKLDVNECSVTNKLYLLCHCIKGVSLTLIIFFCIMFVFSEKLIKFFTKHLKLLGLACDIG